VCTSAQNELVEARRWVATQYTHSIRGIVRHDIKLLGRDLELEFQTSLEDRVANQYGASRSAALEVQEGVRYTRGMVCHILHLVERRLVVALEALEFLVHLYLFD
jgi:hypothetical protein